MKIAAHLTYSMNILFYFIVLNTFYFIIKWISTKENVSTVYLTKIVVYK